MGWPKEYGGQGADVMQQTIVNEELVLARAPQLIGMMGVQMVGPTLIQFGTDEQRRRYLPRILTAEEIWCQGYSEPGAGSDLASLKTRAELVGDEFIVNGQKVWTSNAQIADWMFCLVRTDPERAQAPRHLLPPHRHEDARHHRAPADPDDRRRRLQRGLLRQTCACRARTWSASSTRAGRSPTRRWRTSATCSARRRARSRCSTACCAWRRRRQRYGRPAARGPGHPPAARRSDDPRRGDEVSLPAPAHRRAASGRPPGIGASVNKLVSTELNHDIAALALEIMGNYGPLARNSRARRRPRHAGRTSSCSPSA